MISSQRVEEIRTKFQVAPEEKSITLLIDLK